MPVSCSLSDFAFRARPFVVSANSAVTTGDELGCVIHEF